MPHTIGKYALEVGQWIYLSATENDLAEATEERQKLYYENHFLLVISREDAMFDTCRCNVVDMAGKFLDYCPRMHYLGYVKKIWNDSVNVVDRSDVEKVYGKEKVEEIYTAAKSHLEKRRDYFAKYPAKLLYSDSHSNQQADDVQNAMIR